MKFKITIKLTRSVNRSNLIAGNVFCKVNEVSAVLFNFQQTPPFQNVLLALLQNSQIINSQVFKKLIKIYIHFKKLRNKKHKPAIMPPTFIQSVIDKLLYNYKNSENMLLNGTLSDINKKNTNLKSCSFWYLQLKRA